MKKHLLIALLAITAAICGVFGLAACGDGGNNSENGKYYYIEFDGSIEKGVYYSLESGKWKKDDGENGTYKINGDKIVFYVYEEFTGKDEEWASGVLKDGVLKIVDGFSKETYVSDNHKHSYGEYETETEISCTVDGVEVRTCPCGVSDRKITKCVGYHTGDWNTLKEATCTETGLRTINCTTCKKEISEEIQTLSHDLSDWLHISTDHYKVCSMCKQAFNLESHDSDSFCEVCGYPFNLTLNKDKTGYVVRYPKSDITTVTLPESYNGKPVTELGSNAFSGCTQLTEITIPACVTHIDGSAFSGCTSLTSISVDKGNDTYYSVDNCIINKADKTLTVGCKTSVIPDDGSVTGIGQYAFYGSALKDITLSNHITRIGSYAFNNCNSLENIYFSGDLADWCGISGLENIMSESRTLYIDDKELTELVIPESVTSIANYAFYGSKNLTSVTIHENVTDIGYNAFGGCNNLKKVTAPLTALSSFSKTTLEEVVLTSGENIEYEMFKDYGKLKSITLPDELTSIGDFAFADCYSLESIEIPNSVTEIGGGVFYGCSKLKTFKLSNKITSLNYYYSVLTKMYYGFFDRCRSLKTVIIPDGITSIGDFTFRDCTSLESIKIADSVTSIGKFTFKGCTSLESIEFPDSVTEIGGVMFYGCSKLRTVKLNHHLPIPYYMSSEGNYGFFELCSSLTSVTIGEGVKSINKDTFKGCTSIPEIRYTGGIAGWCGIDGLEILDFSKVYIGEQKLQDITSIVIPDGVTEIADYAFNGCNNILNLTVPDSVTKIGSSAFTGCNSIKKATIPALAILLVNRTNLEEVAITSGNSIGTYAFKDCTSLLKITLPETLTSIGNAFVNCTSLEEIIYDGDIAGWCGIDGLNNLDLSLVFIGNEKLYEMTNIIIPDGVTSIGSYAFKDCNLLERVKIPDSVIYIGDNAFTGCDKLTETELGIIYVDDWAVDTVYDASVTYPNRLKEGTRGIASAALENAYGGWAHYIPASVTAIGDRAFYAYNEQNTRIVFGGTMEQWNAIYKANRWNEIGSRLLKYTIRCSDGDIVIE